MAGKPGGRAWWRDAAPCMCGKTHARHLCCAAMHRNVSHAGELELMTWGSDPLAVHDPWTGKSSEYQAVRTSADDREEGDYVAARGWGNFEVCHCDCPGPCACSVFEIGEHEFNSTQTNELQRVFNEECESDPEQFAKRASPPASGGRYSYDPFARQVGSAFRWTCCGEDMYTLRECHHHGRGCTCDCCFFEKHGHSDPGRAMMGSCSATGPAQYHPSQCNRFLRLPKTPRSFSEWDLARHVRWSPDAHRRLPRLFRQYTMQLLLVWQRQRIPAALVEGLMPRFWHTISEWGCGLGRRFKPSEAVEIHSLKGNPELNGTRGLAQSFHGQKGRYLVQIAGRAKLTALRPENLRAAGGPQHGRARSTAERDSAEAWRLLRASDVPDQDLAEESAEEYSARVWKDAEKRLASREKERLTESKEGKRGEAEGIADLAPGSEPAAGKPLPGITKALGRLSCSECDASKAREDYSKNQASKPLAKRRCTACVAGVRTPTAEVAIGQDETGSERPGGTTTPARAHPAGYDVRASEAVRKKEMQRLKRFVSGSGAPTRAKMVEGTIGPVAALPPGMEMEMRQTLATMTDDQLCMQHSIRLIAAGLTPEIDARGGPAYLHDNETTKHMSDAEWEAKNLEQRESLDRRTAIYHDGILECTAAGAKWLTLTQACNLKEMCKMLGGDSGGFAVHGVPLFEAETGTKWLLNYQEAGGQTAVLVAVIAMQRGTPNALAVLRFLAIEMGAVVDTPAGEGGGTALHFAAMGGLNEAVRVLLEAGASVHSREQDECTPLHLAAQEAKGEAVECLLEAGADPNLLQEAGGTALMMAAQKGCLRAVSALVNAGAAVDVQERKQGGVTALSFAAAKGHAAVVSRLIEAGANVNLNTYGDQIALHEAMLVDSLGAMKETLRVLLRAGADVHLKNRAGYSAMVMAENLSAISPDGRGPSIRTLLQQAELDQRMLVKGALVEVEGLVGAPELNGRGGVVTGWSASKRRYNVQLDAAGSVEEDPPKLVAIKPGNLVADVA